MVRLNIPALLKKKGKNMYCLYKQLGMSYENFRRMANNQTVSIKFENLDALCQLLDCTIEELLILDDN